MSTQTTRVRSRKKSVRETFLTQEFERHRTLRIAAVISIVAVVTLILVGLFAPGLKYSLVAPSAVAVDAPAFLTELEALVSSKITRNNQIEVIENGENFYQAELQAMGQARHSIDVEAYIFHRGKVTDEVLKLLTERAKAGVHVNLVMDSLGSFSTRKNYFKPLKDAGGQVEWYHRLRLHNWSSQTTARIGR